MKVLLIDDDPRIRLSLSAGLRKLDHTVTVAADGDEGMRKLRAERYDVLVCDVRLPGADGFTLLKYARELDRHIDVVLMTGVGGVADAVAAMKQSASDYLEKPFAVEDLGASLDLIAGRRELESELRRRADDTRPHRMVGRSAVMAHVRAQIEAAAPSAAAVLLTGESGTGKELAARSLHERSPRADAPFVAINCASFPDTLLEAELFGHERGAFTGAHRTRTGRFAAAGGGTLFLDEISEMPPLCQAKLLRVLQERQFTPLGTNRVLPLEARIVSATNRPLAQLVHKRRFREDLFYRIKVLSIELPPLRERAGDLPVLVAHFLRRFRAGDDMVLTAAAWNLLAHYSYPGNVRELEHAIQHATVQARARSASEIVPDDLPAEVRAESDDKLERHTPGFPSLGDATREFERKHMLRALRRSRGNKTRAAALLGVSRKTLWEKLRSQGITNADIAAELRVYADDDRPTGV